MECYRRPQRPQVHEQAHPGQIQASSSWSHESAAYIFPSPPSAPPSPSSAAVAPANVNHAPSEAPSAMRSRSTSLVTETTDAGWDSEDARSSSGSMLSALEDLGVSTWEWPTSAERTIGDGGDISPSDVALSMSVVRASMWGVSRRSRRRKSSPAHPLAVQTSRLVASEHPSAPPLPWLRSRAESAASSFSSTIQAPAPRPRIRMPLLSLFASLLGIDESTLDLIQHTRSHSAILPGYSMEHSEMHDDEPRSILPCEQKSIALKEGIRIACDSALTPSSPFVLNPVPLAGMLQIIKGIWSGSGNALREIFQ